MTIIYLLRHGQTDENLRGLWHGDGSGSLNATGKRQALSVAAMLKGSGIQAVISSDSNRAAETARLIEETLGINHKGAYPFLRDRNFGESEGLTTVEIKSKYGFSIENVLDPHVDSIPGSEPVEMLKKRVREAKERICKMFPDKTVLIVSHGGFVRMFYREFAGDVNGKFFTNCSYYAVSCDHEKCGLIHELSSVQN